MKYYIAVASKDHIQKGIEGEFMQANHGKAASLKRLKKEDWVIFYSPKVRFEENEKCQSFTAIGQVKNEELYQGIMSSDFQSFRIKMVFYQNKEISILPLIDELDFIKDKKKWGFAFRFGFLEISEKDFHYIKDKML